MRHLQPQGEQYVFHGFRKLVIFRILVVLFGGGGVMAAVLPARPALGRDCWHTVVSNTLSFALDSIEASCCDAKPCVGRLLSRLCCLAASGLCLSDEARRACCFFPKNSAARAFPFSNISSSRGTADPKSISITVSRNPCLKFVASCGRAACPGGGGL